MTAKTCPGCEADSEGGPCSFCCVEHRDIIAECICGMGEYHGDSYLDCPAHGHENAERERAYQEEQAERDADEEGYRLFG